MFLISLHLWGLFLDKNDNNTSVKRCSRTCESISEEEKVKGLFLSEWSVKAPGKPSNPLWNVCESWGLTWHHIYTRNANICVCSVLCCSVTVNRDELIIYSLFLQIIFFPSAFIKRVYVKKKIFVLEFDYLNLQLFSFWAC